eukprot:936465-Amphidinium_carterae.2
MPLIVWVIDAMNGNLVQLHELHALLFGSSVFVSAHAAAVHPSSACASAHLAASCLRMKPLL